MTTIAIADALKDFAGVLRHVTHGHEAVALRRGSRTVAVLMPPDMAEDIADVEAANAALADYERDPSGAVPWKAVKTEAGIA
jgi:antitoxin (DNA-binding transcriptional repressor) of toxin-antitoxin stability system